jgi:hypothetical protein
LELLGEGALCICSPSTGYTRVNDNPLTVVDDLAEKTVEALSSVGIKPENKPETWFDRADLNVQPYKGKDPPCINSLARGTSEGLRNECGIRLASYFLNFRGYQPNTVQKIMKDWNRLNTPCLDTQELDEIIKSAAQGKYVYGCHDPVLQKACNRETCPIAPKTVMLTGEQRRTAEKILERNDLLDIVLNHGRRRLIGEDNVLLINFVEVCSGQTLYPISGIISGYSGSGKNESLRAIRPLIPPEWIFEFTTSTPEAIKYLPEEFAGTLIIYEAAGVRGDSGSLSLRAIGEGESIETIYPMRNELTGRMEMGRAKTNAKNFITTSSDIDVNPDLYRRVLKQSMNPSYILTRRVCVKELRDSYMPQTLRRTLIRDREPPVKVKDFQNALRVQDWKAEVIVFAPKELLSLVDAAVTVEQQVAVRTQFRKVLCFIKVLALLNQRRRVRVKVGDCRYVIAGPEDYVTGLKILGATILETISRIEKRQRQVLNLLTAENRAMNKNEVMKMLKISAVTAARALKSLANSGYLNEYTASKPYNYEVVNRPNKPNPLVLLENTSEYSSFYEKELETFLNNILSTCHQSVPVSVEVIKPNTNSLTNNYTNTEKNTNNVIDNDTGMERTYASADRGTSDKTSDKVPSEPSPNRFPENNQKPLVSSAKTSENKPDEYGATADLRLIPCPHCRAEGKKLFFASPVDLQAHVNAFHNGSSDITS